MHTMSTRFWHKNWVWQKWYQSRVDRRNASLVRRVIFEAYFTTKTNFTPSLFKISSLLLILLFLAPMLWEKVLPTFFFPNLPKFFFWYLHVYVFVSMHLNEAWRYNEHHAKDEASLSSRLEDTFRWRDARVAPASPSRKMTIRAPPVYVIPYNNSD
jgi:hypothetical protein